MAMAAWRQLWLALATVGRAICISIYRVYRHSHVAHVAGSITHRRRRSIIGNVCGSHLSWLARRLTIYRATRRVRGIIGGGGGVNSGVAAVAA